jgi:hypothetical protein
LTRSWPSSPPFDPRSTIQTFLDWASETRQRRGLIFWFYFDFCIIGLLLVNKIILFYSVGFF